jgi:hypothetical protein
MKPVAILGRIDGRQYSLRVDLLWEGYLHEDAADSLVRVKLPNKRKQIGFSGGSGQLVIEGLHACLGYCLGLRADINLTRRIIPDENDRNPRHDATITAQAMHRVSNPAAQIRSDCFSVNDTRRHCILP